MKEMLEFEELEVKQHSNDDEKCSSVGIRTSGILLIGIYVRSKSDINGNDLGNPKADLHVVFSIKKKQLSAYYISVKDGKYLDLKKTSGYSEPKTWKIANKSKRKQDSKPNVLDKMVIDKMLEELE